MDDLLRVFLDETREHLVVLADDAAALACGNAAACGRVRRIMHTLKGSAGFLGLCELMALAHAGEDLVAVDAGLVEAAALSAVVARIGQQLAAIAAEPSPFGAACASEGEVPLANACAALPAALAALGPALGKEFNLVVKDDGARIGQPLERALRTILLHLVRNAADHGIEAPAARRDAGKAAAGTITVGAWREGTRLWVSVRDDGRGIDLEALGARARTLGVVSAAELSRMNPNERAGLAFRPGVTTAAYLTALSGRGIGLDVVAQTIADLGGAVAITTAPGEGTIFDFSVPLGADVAPAVSGRITAASSQAA